MKFIVAIGGQDAILTSDQLDQLVAILGAAHRIENKWVGSGKGDNGDSYLKLIRTYSASDMSVKIMTDQDFDARVLITKMQDEQA